jgi:hypothetical protein
MGAEHESGAEDRSGKRDHAVPGPRLCTEHCFSTPRT